MVHQSNKISFDFKSWNLSVNKVVTLTRCLFSVNLGTPKSLAHHCSAAQIKPFQFSVVVFCFSDKLLPFLLYADNTSSRLLMPLLSYFLILTLIIAFIAIVLWNGPTVSHQGEDCLPSSPLSCSCITRQFVSLFPLLISTQLDFNRVTHIKCT